jgi:diketogulonate reductase-like aldo/keto reductase
VSKRTKSRWAIRIFYLCCWQLSSEILRRTALVCLLLLFICFAFSGNEKEIGDALKQAFDEGLVQRDDLFLTGKLWNSDHEVEIVPRACDYSLNNLGLDYFDLYLIHFPIAWKHSGLSSPGWGSSELGDTPLIDTWRAMETLVDTGKAKSIGISNFPLMMVHDLVNQARIPVSCHQIEAHAYYTRESLVNYCLSRDICVTAHTPLGGGVSQKQMFQVSTIPLEDPVIQKIAESCKKSPAQVLLRFLLQRGIVVLPKSVKPHRMKENINVFDVSLTAKDMTAIMGLDKYVSAKTNPNPLSSFLGGPDAFCAEGTDIFD